jgi:acyl-CoA thioesterase FadM
MYFEEARWAYWGEVVGSKSLDKIDYVLAEARVRWLKRVLWPQTVSVGVCVTRVGRKHFEMTYEVSGEAGDALITGVTTQVMYDYTLGASVRLAEDLRARLEEFDGPFAAE